MSYRHNGDESTADGFSLDISDGMHDIPIKIQINVIPIDDEAPQLAANLDGSLALKITVKERGTTPITSKVRFYFVYTL